VNAFSDAATEETIAAAVEEIEETRGWQWVPSQSRMEPEEPADEIVAAKLRLFAVLENWDIENSGADFDQGEAQFRIADVALLLREHHRLREIEDRIRDALAPTPSVFKHNKEQR
jgi:hypothetical protein